MYNPFTTEAWIEYGVGTLILLARIAARCSRIGLKWEGDDYFAMLSVFFFTGELVMLQIIGELGSITGMTNEKALTLTPEETRHVVIGSKCLLAGWIIYTTLIWCLKGCMLFFYKRLTLNLQQQNLVNITGGVCTVAYIATITVYLTHCHPLHRLWQVYPYPGNDCALNISKYLALVVTNVTTDAMILYIPLPLLWSVRLPLQKKAIYAFWLCTGIFIMTATLLRCILCLQDVSQINVGTIWSIRETFVGIIAVNVPILKPFFSKAKNAVSSTKASKDSSSADANALPFHLRLSHVDRKGKKRTVHDITGLDTEMTEGD
ncbi:integral membrane PTH11 [Pyrenophora seminiperda CCB06]|uniref:Integral membrane PTH11 n=1 Tax=Pyrenophora seminiperda CCB06 TaxID=1302712 RepID=A0A3M7MGJ3_9PLEO|nr:integral membrane PTH11 [Pyrenophora seminiperda CCB06]